MSAVVFAERRQTVHVLSRTGTDATVEVGRYQGMGWTTYHDGGSRHEYVSGVDPADRRLAAPGRELLAPLAEPWRADPAEPELTGLAQALRRHAEGAGWSRFTVSLRSYSQQVVAGAPAALRRDDRRFCTVSLEASAGDRGRDGVDVRLDSGVRELADLPALAHAFARRLPGELADAARMPYRPLPAGVRPVVLAEGPAAMFFHEICGHPMEADVVASGASYLGRRRGRRVAPEWFTLVDDPLSGQAVFGYRVDDEGEAAQAVALVAEGIVRDVLHCRTTAAAAGCRSNGHGRRMSYLYPAIPRQAHTRVLPGPHSPPEVTAGPGEAVLVPRFRVRHVHMDSGEFSFLAPRAVLLVGGEPVARLRDLRLWGTGEAALAGVQAVGTETAAWIGGGGCGKLDQGPLVVGFEQPLVRIHGLHTATAGGD